MSCDCDGNSGQTGRREACRWLALSVLAAGVGATPCSMRADEGAVVARLIAIPAKSVLLVESAAVILVRSATGLAALSARCTHQNRKLNVDARGRIACPAHGSVFDQEGKPVSGPATRRLTWYAVAVDEDGNIRVDTGQVVKSGSWAPLPNWAVAKRP